MPRALLITENAPVPSDRRVFNEARALRDAGWEVVVVCAMGDGRDDAPHEVLEDIAIYRYPLVAAAGGLVGYAREYLQALWRIRKLARRLARERPFDVVHAGNPPDFLLAAVRSLRKQGTKLVFDHHDLVPELYQAKFGGGKGMMYRVAVALERVAFRMADVVICTNGSYRRVALERGGRAAEDVFVVRNGPDLARFRPVDPDPAWRRGRAHLIGYLGIMGPQDGVDHAIRALAAIAERDDWQAVFIGDGESLPDMKALAVELGIADRVEFAGWRYDDDIRAILSTCDVCLAPDPPSPLNDVSTMIKIPEYLAMGCAVASYDLPESRVSAADAAVYATPGDTAALGAAVAALLDDPARREAMALEGQADVRDRLAWQHQVPALLAAYARATGTTTAPVPEPVTAGVA
ncbi:glycosyltransferase family 4 protein [Baekduia sp. Peel2402]|uniref:glycosyltransferase family 4 protein n=1 Tax=Baekduia sp. Peel2402 TaxID=3458296 RepID=UPI00403E4791